MQITKNALVTINYTLKGDDGNLIDTSVGAEPLIYLHGQNFLLPKLEEYLEGKSAGEKITAVLPPEDGYGIYDERMVAKSRVKISKRRKKYLSVQNFRQTRLKVLQS